MEPFVLDKELLERTKNQIQISVLIRYYYMLSPGHNNLNSCQSGLQRGMVELEKFRMLRSIVLIMWGMTLKLYLTTAGL